MNLGISASYNLSQQQKLSFHMIQSLKMLQVNTLQLEQMLRAELELNPLLEIEDEVDQEIETDADDRNNDDDELLDPNRDDDKEYLEELESGEDGIDWEEYLEEGFDLGYSYNEETDSSEERYEPSPVYQETLEERLTEQLAEKKIEERIRLLVQFLIGSLDDDGYLRIPLADIADFTETAVCEVEDAIGVLQKLEPAGVGARDLRECMILQLRAGRMEDSLAMTIVTDHWGDFEKLKVFALAKSLNVEPRQVQEAMDIIKALNPKPGHLFGADKSAVIIPDLIVEKIDGKFVVMLNDRSIPSLCINKGYASMIKRGSKAQQEVKEYVRDKLNSATWFIKAIEQRRTTIYRVMSAIVARQEAFFAKGPVHLVPMKQQEIADMIGMHMSTVSRVTSNKYVQTPHGIFELKSFFSEAFGKKAVAGKKTLGQDSDNDGSESDITADRIKNRIKQLIDDEDPTAPIPDQKIADILVQDNLPVARRTVAKYREQMKILPTRMRQKYE